jgi:hypothetical protein
MAVAIASARIGVPRLSCNTFFTAPIREVVPAAAPLVLTTLLVIAGWGAAAELLLLLAVLAGD